MVSDSDRENVTKAVQSADLLLSDVRQIGRSSNPLLAEIATDALAAAEALAHRLQRLHVVVNTN